MTLEERIQYVEADDRSHRARLLLLLLAYREAASETSLDLVRLAYLDYFLRYPVSLERVLLSRRQSVSKLRIKDFERQSIDGQLGALRVEPWDSEYRRWIAAEFAAGRIAADLVQGVDFTVRLTDTGILAAIALRQSELFSEQSIRAHIIVTKLNLQAKTLRSVINATLPETVTLHVSNA